MIIDGETIPSLETMVSKEMIVLPPSKEGNKSKSLQMKSALSFVLRESSFFIENEQLSNILFHFPLFFDFL